MDDVRASLLVRGLQLHSALYLAACFLAGIQTHNGWAWRLAIAAMGVTYLSYLTQLAPEYIAPEFAQIAVWASIILGAAAGLALLF